MKSTRSTVPQVLESNCYTHPGEFLETGRSFDLAIVSNGYENRSSYVGRNLLQGSSVKACFPFRHGQVHSYFRNLELLQAAGFEIQDPDSDFLSGVIGLIDGFTGERAIDIAVDISSMTRVRMGATIAALVSAATTRPIRASFFYATGVYEDPPAEAGPLLTPRAVLQHFAGWSGPPSLPVMAVVGLGYEPQRAIGALEYVEPEESVVFRPSGGDERFERALDISNEPLLRSVHSDRILQYPIRDPLEMYLRLESFVFAVRQTHRVLLIPMGPKVFALGCLLVAAGYDPWLPVWRVSAGDREIPRECTASGVVTQLNVNFGGPHA